MTKAQAATRREIVRCLARLNSQARLNAGDAKRLGRVSEERAWSEVALFLAQLMQLTLDRGLPVQLPIPFE